MTFANRERRCTRRDHFEDLVLRIGYRLTALALRDVANAYPYQPGLAGREPAEAHLARDLLATGILVHPLECRMAAFERLVDVATAHAE